MPRRRHPRNTDGIPFAQVLRRGAACRWAGGDRGPPGRSTPRDRRDPAPAVSCERPGRAVHQAARLRVSGAHQPLRHEAADRADLRRHARPGAAAGGTEDRPHGRPASAAPLLAQPARRADDAAAACSLGPRARRPRSPFQPPAGRGLARRRRPVHHAASGLHRAPGSAGNGPVEPRHVPGATGRQRLSSRPRDRTPLPAPPRHRRPSCRGAGPRSTAQGGDLRRRLPGAGGLGGHAAPRRSPGTHLRRRPRRPSDPDDPAPRRPRHLCRRRLRHRGNRRAGPDQARGPVRRSPRLLRAAARVSAAHRGQRLASAGGDLAGDGRRSSAAGGHALRLAGARTHRARDPHRAARRDERARGRRLGRPSAPARRGQRALPALEAGRPAGRAAHAGRGDPRPGAVVARQVPVHRRRRRRAGPRRPRHPPVPRPSPRPGRLAARLPFPHRDHDRHARLLGHGLQRRLEARRRRPRPGDP